jgi:uncharacterized protein
MNSLQKAEGLWAKVCFDPKFQPRGRYNTYRNLIVNGLLDSVKGICPVTRSILSEKEWDKVFWAFLKNSTMRSVILRDVAFEFADYLKSHRHPLLKKYPYLGELIEYEAMEIKLRFAPEDEGKTSSGKLRLNPAHALVKYPWPVHFISEEFCNPKKLPRGEYYLLLWRELESLDVKFMEVNALVASLIQCLEGGEKSAVALLHALAKQHGIQANKEFLSEGEALIQELIAKDILLSC